MMIFRKGMEGNGREGNVRVSCEYYFAAGYGEGDADDLGLDGSCHSVKNPPSPKSRNKIIETLAPPVSDR